MKRFGEGKMQRNHCIEIDCMLAENVLKLGIEGLLYDLLGDFEVDEGGIKSLPDLYFFVTLHLSSQNMYMSTYKREIIGVVLATGPETNIFAV